MSFDCFCLVGFLGVGFRCLFVCFGFLVGVFVL